ncbi:TPA: hypothetical protein UMF63_001464 [Stenotrophomonas maltophilia]|nr:hypothetical protein [Stenotrophomonas maltophilia]
MNTLVHQKRIRLRLHLLLFSIPCALAGVLVALVLLMIWISRQSSEAFLMAIANWSVMSVWSAYAALMLANTWRTAGAQGLHARKSWLEALPIVSAFQAAAAVSMLFAATGWAPGLLLAAPVLIIIGAPWASLSWHLRWLSRLEE